MIDKLVSKVLTKTMSWNVSCVMAVAAFIYLFVMLVSILTPVMYSQIIYLYSLLSDERLYVKVYRLFDLNNFSFLTDEPFASIKRIAEPHLHSMVDTVMGKVASLVQEVANRGLGATKSFVSSVHNIFYALLAFVMSFHILREWYLWPHRLSKLSRIGPIARYSERIQIFAETTGLGIQNWIKGQVSIALLLAVYYSTCFILVGVAAPVAVGCVFGFVSFIPYVGDLIGFTALGIAFSYATPSLVQIVLSIVLIVAGHALSGYVLGPALVGKRTGIHPIQFIFGLLLHSKLFGIAGIFLNVPFCVITNALLKSLTYKKLN